MIKQRKYSKLVLMLLFGFGFLPYTNYTVSAESTPIPENIYAVVIGCPNIDGFPQRSAQDDAISFQNFLKDHLSYDQTHIELLSHNHGFFPQNIADAISTQISKMTKEDYLLIYYSGFSEKTTSTQLCAGYYNDYFDEIQYLTIAPSHMYAWIDDSPGKIIMILDTDYAQSFLFDVVNMDNTQHNGKFPHVGFVSTLSNETCVDGGGIFTEEFIGEYKNCKDSNSDRIISLNEIEAKVKADTMSRTEEIQTPNLWNGENHDFTLTYGDSESQKKSWWLIPIGIAGIGVFFAVIKFVAPLFESQSIPRKNKRLKKHALKERSPKKTKNPIPKSKKFDATPQKFIKKKKKKPYRV